MDKAQMLIKYIQYKTRSFTDHDLHSPFVFDLYTELIRNRHPHYAFEGLSEIRRQLLNDTGALEVTDFGAGSRVFKGSTRRVKDIARHGISTKKYAELIFRLANKYAPRHIVELGTSLGLGTLYLARACPKATVYTIEGSEEIYRFASELFVQEQQENIQSIYGNFDAEFPKLVDALETLDFLYTDGNHAYEPTMRYFRQALEKKNTRSVFVFDDIHWSEGMEQAWEEIRSHPEVTLSLDLFQVGIVFFRKEQKQKEHFVLRY
jgi:predicted O-methyltransferase YrrM